jgi:hypothetical protein
MTYTIFLSNKNEIVIDDEDYKKFTENVKSGNLIKLKRAIINPSFVVSIIPDSIKSQRRIEGHIDQLTGNYVIDREGYEPLKLADEFQEAYKKLQAGKKI